MDFELQAVSDAGRVFVWLCAGHGAEVEAVDLIGRIALDLPV